MAPQLKQVGASSWLNWVFGWVGPAIALAIMTEIIVSSTYSALQLWCLPASVEPYMREIHFYSMYVWMIPIFWSFYKAIQGPGYVPPGWKPVSQILKMLDQASYNI